MRTHNATFHNALANIPEVAASLGWNPADHPETDGRMLFDHLADDPNTYLMHVGDGTELPALAMIFCWSAPHVFEAHTISDPKRCQNAVQDAKSLIHEMLMQHDAQMVWGRPSSSNLRACRFFEKIGATKIGEGHHAELGAVTFYGGYKEPWLERHWNTAG